MSYMCALGFMTAVLCGIWSYGSEIVGLLGWAGFAGCTTYFACGSKGLEGLKNTIFPNMSGVIWGMVIITLGSIAPFPGSGGVYCAIVTFFMCVQNKFKLLSFIPGTFMGCFSTFAAGGNWKLLVPSLLLGALLGIACDKSGGWLFSRFGKPEVEEKIEKVS